jgi:transcriptional regulator with XRE-family HTH domain
MKRTEPRNPKETQYLRQHLQALMEERTLSPGELASVAIIPLSSLLRILDGTIKNPGVDVTLSLAKALGVTASELLGDTIINENHATLYIECQDRLGLLHDITKVIKGEGLNITSSISTKVGRGARCVLHFDADSETKLQRIGDQIMAKEGIWKASFWIRDHEGNISSRKQAKVSK